MYHIEFKKRCHKIKVIKFRNLLKDKKERGEYEHHPKKFYIRIFLKRISTRYKTLRK